MPHASDFLKQNLGKLIEIKSGVVAAQMAEHRQFIGFVEDNLLNRSTASAILDRL